MLIGNQSNSADWKAVEPVTGEQCFLVFDHSLNIMNGKIIPLGQE